MKRLASILVLALAACGGGSGGGTPNSLPVAPSPTPLPTSTPAPVANTSLPYYLPLANGNSWTFATGGKMLDMGGGTLSCTCAANGIHMEQLALYSPGSTTISGSFFFTKTPATSQHGELTNLVGIEQDANNNNVTIISDTAIPDGFPVMDDTPSVNESWADSGVQSTITAIGGTMLLPSGAKIVNIATDELATSSGTITWSLAQGVGLTGLAVDNESTTITSFSVNTATSDAAARRPDSTHGLRFTGGPGKANARALLRSLWPRAR